MSKGKPRVKKRGRTWQVDFGRSRRPDGTEYRERMSFKTRNEAEAEIDARGIESENRIVKLTHLTDSQRRDVLDALDILDGKASLKVATRFYIRHGKPEGGLRKLEEVAEEYIESKRRAGRRPATITDAEVKVDRFVREVGKTHTHEVMTEDVEAWLNGQGFTPATWDSYRKAVRGLMGFALKRKYIGENPVLAIEAVEFDQAMPEVMDVADVRKIMTAAAKHHPEMVPHFAIGYFAGLRKAELEGLRWESISLQEKLITVTPATAKKRRQRHVEMTENLIAWLTPYWRPSGSVFYSRRYFRDVRDKAEVAWADNIMRHSYASYHLARWQDPAKTSLQLGHQRADVLFSNYRNIKTMTGRNVTQKLAGQFWRIKPRKDDAKLIRFAVA